MTDFWPKNDQKIFSKTKKIFDRFWPSSLRFAQNRAQFWPIFWEISQEWSKTRYLRGQFRGPEKLLDHPWPVLDQKISTFFRNFDQVEFRPGRTLEDSQIFGTNVARETTLVPKFRKSKSNFDQVLAQKGDRNVPSSGTFLDRLRTDIRTGSALPKFRRKLLKFAFLAPFLDKTCLHDLKKGRSRKIDFIDFYKIYT